MAASCVNSDKAEHYTVYQPVCPVFVLVNQSHQQYCSTSVCGHVIMQGKNYHNYHVGCRYGLALANSANNIS